MLTKIIPPGSYDLGDRIAEIVRLSRTGPAFHDKRAFEKRAAAEILHDLNGVRDQLHRGEELVHLYALGTTERYGCFAAGTPISAADGQYVPIENISIGDQVLSADGNICEVSYVFRRDVERSLDIDVCGLADTLRCSEDHPFRVARKEQFACTHDKYKRCLPPTQGEQNICNRTLSPRACVLADYPAIAWEWAKADSLREGDFLIWTAPQLTPPISMCASEGYLLGAWLAEGSFQRNGSNGAIASIRLSIHRDELVFLQQLQSHAAAIGLRVNNYNYQGTRNENERIVCINGDPTRFRLWHTLFNEHAKSKRLPPWVCCLPLPTRLAIIAGYFDGDGSCAVDEKENRTTARSHGEDLSAGIQRLCWSAGLPAVRCRVKDEGWNVSVANSYLDDVANFSWKIRGRALSQTTKVHGFYHAGRMYLPIRAIRAAGAAVVYNFEVAGDHTYSGPNIDSHNCNRNGDGFKAAACRKYHDTFVKHAKFFRDHHNKATSPHYGRIIKSAFNDPMGRVELLVALFGTKEAADRFGGHLADKELDALGSGKDISCSMACGVERDFCSYCDNAAPRAADYCRGVHEGGRCKAGGLRNNMGSLVEVDGDLHHLHADNRDPKFFDISNVWRPADRIAYVTGSLQKAAGERGVVKSADLARMLGVTVPASLLVEQAGNPRTAAAVKIAYQLADIESDIARGILPLSTMSLAAMSPQMQSAEEFLPPPDDREKFASVLRALADVRVCLPLTQFVEYATGAPKEKAAAVAAVVANDLPGIFSELVSSGELVDRLENNPYTPSEHTNLKHAVWARQQVPACGVDSGSVQRRVDLAAIRNFVPTLRDPSVREKSATDAASRRLATEYALYKIAFLNAIPQMSSDFVLTASLLTLQNHAT